MRISSLDLELYDMVLGELSQDTEFLPWQLSQEPGGIGPRVLNYTSKVDADTLQWSLDCSRAKQAAYQPIFTGNILARNSATASLDGYSPGHGAALVTRDELTSHFNNPAIRSQCGASRRCIIRFAVPGYASRKWLACVFFWFEDGRASGGGAGIVGFAKSNGVWRISAKHIAYHTATSRSRPRGYPGAALTSLTPVPRL